MNVLLIDADSTIPNLALMKISSWHKYCGDSVSLIKANLPYYPTRKKKPFTIPEGFDKIYCSVIFERNKDYIIEPVKNTVIFGGTGVDLKKKLPRWVEDMYPDYTIYPNNSISYGFITRGCIRSCSFCKVPEKEGYIHKVSEIDDIVKHSRVKFMDNNILAYPKHKEILQELISRRIRCQFNQGLDIRLLDEENSKLLSKLRYLGEYVFAFDNLSQIKKIEQKMNLLEWRKPWQVKFFVYVHPDMPITETIQRIRWLKKNKCLPYIMRDIRCWDSPLSKFYIDLAAYCNQPAFFKNLSFMEFLNKRHNNQTRISDSSKIWNVCDSQKLGEPCEDI